MTLCAQIIGHLGLEKVPGLARTVGWYPSGSSALSSDCPAPSVDVEVRSANATGTANRHYWDPSADLPAETQLNIQESTVQFAQRIRSFTEREAQTCLCRGWACTCKDNTDRTILCGSPATTQGLAVTQRLATRAAISLSRHIGWCTLKPQFSFPCIKVQKKRRFPTCPRRSA